MAIVEYEAPVEVLTEREQRARTLEAAALEIEVHGWASCDRMSDGSMCVNGALFTALGWDGDYHSLNKSHEVFKNWMNEAQRVWGDDYSYCSIASRNDRWSEADGPTRSVAVLRDRAASIRNGEVA